MSIWPVNNKNILKQSWNTLWNRINRKYDQCFTTNIFLILKRYVPKYPITFITIKGAAKKTSLNFAAVFA